MKIYNKITLAWNEETQRYDDVVYEGQSIEMERLWLWVVKNIPRQCH